MKKSSKISFKKKFNKELKKRVGKKFKKMKIILFLFLSFFIFSNFQNSLALETLPQNFAQFEKSEKISILKNLIKEIRDKINKIVAQKEAEKEAEKEKLKIEEVIREKERKEKEEIKKAEEEAKRNEKKEDAQSIENENKNLNINFNKEKEKIDGLIFEEKKYSQALSKIKDLKKIAWKNEDFLVLSNLEKRQKITEEYLSQKTQKQNGELYYWGGTVRHAFWHSLIVDPKKAFRGRKAKGFHDYMVTVEETKTILDELYERDWILVDYNDLYDFSNPYNIKKKKLYLPKGKKPLIVSIDDVSYYSYMKGYGFLQKLVLDEKNEITGKYTDDGRVSYRRDGELMMVLDDFVYSHPDFSYNGAKGIIALTGYEGVLGYRTNTGNKTLITEAKKVADRLQTQGWKFASHSYHHKEYKTLSSFKYDLNRWINEVWPIVGDTNIFISPFGYRMPWNSQRMAYLNSQGFQVFAPVSAYDWTREHKNIIIMDRIDFDGIRMTISTKFLKPFYDIDDVYDNVNRLVKR